MKIAIHTVVTLLLLSLFACRDDSQNPVAQQAPEGMVKIPEGRFLMGGKSPQASRDEFPRHEVQISAFYMDIHEVTNRQFKAFVDETGYVTVAERPIDWEEMKQELPPGTPKPAADMLQAGSLVFQPTDGPVNLRDYSRWWRWTVGANWRQPQGPGSSIEGKMDHPVVHIAYEDAKAYAEWAGKRLPTEAEWEWAAMGGMADSKYPWGNTPAADAFDQANFWQGPFPYQNTEQDGFFGTAPVQTFPANGYGLYDMAGNVWEWCQDKYHVRAYEMGSAQEVSKDPQGPEASFDPQEPRVDKCVIRGGSFLCHDSYCSGYRVARRMGSDKNSSFNHTGFRCARDMALE